jgi:hypothetical protein
MRASFSVRGSLHVGHAEDAIVTLGEELAAIEQSGAHEEAAELHRLKGEAILMRDSLATAEAEACFRKAIEVARNQSAKWWEQRATVRPCPFPRSHRSPRGGARDARRNLQLVH